MPYDILHCSGEKCPLNQSCLRCTGISYGRRDFFGKPPYNFVSQSCAHYWDDRPSDDKIRQRAYQLWQQSGCEHGHDQAHWLQARQQLIEQLRNS